MKKIIAIMLGALTLVAPMQQAKAEELKDMYITCYCPESCPGEITYTGATVREGIAAVTEEHIGDAAIIYTQEGECLGIWECLDKIGTGKSNVIDIWVPNMDSCKDYMKLTDGKVKVIFVQGVRG